MKSLLVTAVAVAAVGGATLLGVNTVSAQATGTSLVERIATSFDLNQTEVQAVVDEFHEQRQAERAQAVEDRLQTKVDDGTITSEQRAELLALLDDMHSTREATRGQDLTMAERHEQMEAARDKLQTWADDNNIELSELMPFGGGHGGPGGLRLHGLKDGPTDQ